jgi:lysophospholipase L1-like esterase
MEGWIVDDPMILARTGWTTDELLEAIARERLEGTFDVVSLLIGVNNQYRGRSAEEYRVEFRTLANLAIRLAGNRTSRTMVLSIPDWGVTPYAEGKNRMEIAAEIDRFNDVNRKESQALGVHYVDVTPLSRNAATDQDLVTVDGLHPSGKMYSTWVNIILKNVLAMT